LVKNSIPVAMLPMIAVVEVEADLRKEENNL
jgi:hypothetical protein